VLTSSQRPGALDDLGLIEAELREINPASRIAAMAAVLSALFPSRRRWKPS
jgi:crotonobetainyl-CoA:carnitine CoA-transferase CaiB-like acyl-CoA transferase